MARKGHKRKAGVKTYTVRWKNTVTGELMEVRGMTSRSAALEFMGMNNCAVVWECGNKTRKKIAESARCK